MIPREPDRFEVIADRIVARGLDAGELADDIAAALRAEHANAIEWVAVNLYGGHHGAAIRALASPAAAPAAEIGTCANFWHPGHGKEIHTRREAVGDVSAVHADYVNDSGCINWRPAPPSESAAPEKEIANLLGRGHVENPREGEPGDAETYSSPAPLLPRVLTALEQEASNHDEYDSRYEYERATLLRALAAELRAYIAKAKGEGKT